MAKKKKAKGKQLDLIDVQPKNVKTIIEVVERYKKHQKLRLAELKMEVEAKKTILELVHKARLQPLEDGTIRFKVDGRVICVTPTEEKVTITEAKGKKK